jgi:TonB family protein
MPNAPIQPGSPATSERRRHERFQPSGLVYLDIGTENGGIILDLNEAGAGIQAVAPLAVLSNISVRFQLPDLPQRVHTEAQVTWVSESRRRVGLQFTSVPDEVRAQIRDWLRSQSPTPLERPAEIAPPAPPQFDAAPPDLLNEKWSNLLNETGPRGKYTGTSVVAQTQSNSVRDVSFTGKKDSVGVQLRGFLREIALEKALESSETAAAYRDTGSGSIDSGEQMIVDQKAFEPNLLKGERAEVIHWPGPAADRATEPAALKGAAIPVPKPAVSAPALEKLPISPALTGPVTVQGSRGLWKIAIAVILLLAASFEIGKSLGNIGAPIGHPDPARVPVKDVESGVNSPTRRSIAREQRGTSLREDRTGHGGGNVTSQHAAPVANLPPPVQTQPSIPTAPSAVPKAPALPNPPGPSIDAAHASQELPPAPNTGTSAQVPDRIIVDGRVLMATDRFNPAHLLYRFDPDYPPDAKQQKVEGTILLRVSINASGSVDRVQLLSGPPLLVPAAISAVKNWRYLPALLNGQAVKSEQDVSIEFRLPPTDQ